MKIAIISPRDPIPIYTGLLERIFQLSQHLAESNDVRVYYPYEPERKRDEEGREPTNLNFERIPLRSPFINFLDDKISSYSPLRGLYNIHPWLLPPLINKLRSYNPDAVIVEMPYLGLVGMLATPADTRTVLTEHNIEYKLAERLDISFSSLLKKYELWIANQFDEVVAVSAHDANILSDELDGPVRVAPNGVDTERYSPGESSALKNLPDSDMNFIYHGNLGNAQNKEAVNILLEDIYPQLRDYHDSCNLLLIGANPPEETPEGVIATGIVEDLPEYLRCADIAIVPLQSGSGTKLKIMEYLATGIPVVTTPVGKEGIPLTHGEDVMVGETPERIVDLVKNLCEDNSLRQTIGKRGRKMAVEEYDWNETLEVYDKVTR